MPWRYGMDVAAAESAPAAALRGGTKEREGWTMRGDEGRESEAALERGAELGDEQAAGERETKRFTAGIGAVKCARAQEGSASATEWRSEQGGRCDTSTGSAEDEGREGGEDKAGASRRPPCLRILLIDNYDSYTYNLAHLLTEVNGGEAGARAGQERAGECSSLCGEHCCVGGVSAVKCSATAWICMQIRSTAAFPVSQLL